jgi:hypothetical protein
MLAVRCCDLLTTCNDLFPPGYPWAIQFCLFELSRNTAVFKRQVLQAGSVQNNLNKLTCYVRLGAEQNVRRHSVHEERSLSFD